MLYDMSEDERIKKFQDKKWLKAANLPLALADDTEKAEMERKQLALNTASDGSASTYTLIQEVVHDEVIAGAEPVRCMRDVINFVDIPRGPSLRVPYGGSGRYAPKVPEMGQIPENQDTYGDVDINIYKYGEISAISEEMINDGLFDMITLELRKIGFAIENALNRAVLDKLIANISTTSIDPAGTHIALSDIAKGRADVLAENWNPDKVVFHPTAEGYLLQDSNLVYVAYAGQGRTLETGQIPKMLGLIPYTCTATDTNGYWGTTSTGTPYTTAMILDTIAPVAMGATVGGIKLDQFNDPLTDLKKVKGIERFGVETIHTAAGLKIFHK